MARYMTDLEAQETVKALLDRAVADCDNLKSRIFELKQDYKVDAWEDTAAQITRLENRLVVKDLEAAALEIAYHKFE